MKPSPAIDPTSFSSAVFDARLSMMVPKQSAYELKKKEAYAYEAL